MLLVVVVVVDVVVVVLLLLPWMNHLQDYVLGKEGQYMLCHRWR